jgi:xylose isomerase
MGHDMQPRAYDNESQAVGRVARSILSWDACEKAASEIDVPVLMGHLANRDTASAEDMMREAVESAGRLFSNMA